MDEYVLVNRYRYCFLQFSKLDKEEKEECKMKFLDAIPEYESFYDVPNSNVFLSCGQPELCSFLKSFLVLDDVRIQTQNIDEIKKWLSIETLQPVNEVKERSNELCLVSQIIVNNKLIANYPYVLHGRDVYKYRKANSLLEKIAEAISDQITACFLQGFSGGIWLFGDSFAQMLIANCVSSSLHGGIEYAHLIEKMEQLSVSTFEGQFFTTGIIVTSNSRHYTEKHKFKKSRTLDEMEKREWFLADGQNTFFLSDSQCNINSIATIIGGKQSLFDISELVSIIQAPDFIIRTTGPNEVSVFDSSGKEYVKTENTWHYRYKLNLIEFLKTKIEGITDDLCNRILYFAMRCSRSHISTIIWIPADSSDNKIKSVTTNNRIRIWDKCLNVLEGKDEPLILKILASDGAIVINKNGDILYESVFADVAKIKQNANVLAGTGETAAKCLSDNGVAIKVSQDGTIKIYSENEKWIY